MGVKDQFMGKPKRFHKHLKKKFFFLPARINAKIAMEIFYTKSSYNVKYTNLFSD